jgi:hypothetical protein
MPPRVNQMLWHPCRKIISLVSKYCYNFAAGLPQNHLSYSKVLPIFFLQTLKRINLHLKKAIRFLGILEFAFLECRRFILTTCLITISQISFLSFIHSQTQLFVSIASPP